MQLSCTLPPAAGYFLCQILLYSKIECLNRGCFQTDYFWPPPADVTSLVQFLTFCTAHKSQLCVQWMVWFACLTSSMVSDERKTLFCYWYPLACKNSCHVTIGEGYYWLYHYRVIDSVWYSINTCRRLRCNLTYLWLWCRFILMPDMKRIIYIQLAIQRDPEVVMCEAITAHAQNNYKALTISLLLVAKSVHEIYNPYHNIACWTSILKLSVYLLMQKNMLVPMNFNMAAGSVCKSHLFKHDSKVV